MKNIGFYLLLFIDLIILCFTFFVNVYEFPEDKEMNNINYDAVDILKVTFLFLFIINFLYLLFQSKNLIIFILNLIIILICIFSFVEVIRLFLIK